jgi:phosphate:Na+ symporter
METFLNIFKLLAGIGLFLFAMYLIEDSLKNLSGRNFKLFLQRITKNKIGAVTGGAIVTGILQSSSMVSFIVLAFVGAGIFTMKNALAIILGANLGTTLDSWMVATLGFKTNIEVIAYPAVFVGGLLLILFHKRESIKYISYFIFGFGLLFIGLSFMKTAMEAQVKTFDLSNYSEMPLVVFLLIGFLITLLVQSSSVTMALTLTALHVGALNFPSAAALVLGSETGTTIKILVSGIGGTASKKRVVLGNLLFNVFLTIFAFIFIRPILHLITDIFNVTDPLIGLVTFSSLVNLFSIIIFLPFLDPFSAFLERFFKTTASNSTAFICHANIEEPQTALDLFKRETEYFILNSMLFNLEQLEIDTNWLEENQVLKPINESKKISLKTPNEKYEFLKLLQGELQLFFVQLETKLKDEQSTELRQLVSAVRSAMHSVKSIKDIKSNIMDLKNSSKDIKFLLFTERKTQTENLYKQLNVLLQEPESLIYEKLKTAFNGVEEDYSLTLAGFYKDAQKETMEGMDITTAINFNRELFTSNKAITMAIKDLLLNQEQAEAFNDVPVYKT